MSNVGIWVSFSALLRAENSEMHIHALIILLLQRFSALLRAENSEIDPVIRTMVVHARFSALLRAENSEIAPSYLALDKQTEFQCSSASRKFGNPASTSDRRDPIRRFSALLRAENSEIAIRDAISDPMRLRFSALLRAENSEIFQHFVMPEKLPAFQCSSASRKFGNDNQGPCDV